MHFCEYKITHQSDDIPPDDIVLLHDVSSSATNPALTIYNY